MQNASASQAEALQILNFTGSWQSRPPRRISMTCFIAKSFGGHNPVGGM